MRRPILLLTTFTLFTFQVVLLTHAASFDCTQTHAADEVAICDHRDLSELDVEMAALWFAYRRVPMLMGANAERHDEAAEFLKRRTACGSDAACLRQAYNARIELLKQHIERAMRTVQQSEMNAPGTSSPALPVPVEAIMSGYARQCRELGGALTGDTKRPQIMSGDFDGDGAPDYVINPQNLRCSAAATAFCGNGGCQIAIAISSNRYRDPNTVLGAQPTLVQKPTGAVVELWVQRSNCGVPNREHNGCWATYSWQGGKVNKTYQSKPQQAGDPDRR